MEKHGLQLVQASQEEQLATDALLYIEQGHIVFTASCLSTECMFLTGLEISDSSYRELVAGFPEGFRIEKYSVMLFTYDNSKDNGNFKIKINRRKGFPHYRLCSLKKGKPFNECINQLRKAREDISIDNENDERYVSGRSHELRIDEDSDDYCTRCLYFIALYSNY